MAPSASRPFPFLVRAAACALVLAPAAARTAGLDSTAVELRRFGVRGEPAPDSPSFSARAAPVPSTRGDVRELYRKVAPATVVVRTQSGHGSGVVVSPDGLVLTNHHVASDGQREGLKVKLAVELGRIGPDGVMQRSGETIPAYVLKWDRRLDLAVLKLSTVPEGMAAIGVSGSNPTPGEPVAALGHGGIGLLWAIRDCQVASVGHLYDSLARAVLAPARADRHGASEALRRARRESPARVIQSTCPIAPGDSGGPLVNATGDLVGLNDFLIGDERVPVAANFHVDVSEIRAFLADVPSEAPPLFPDPWDAGGEGALEDHDSDGKPETLVLRGDEGAAFFVALADVPPAGTVEEILDRRAFASEVVLAEREDELFAWYATEGAAPDLVLAGDPGTGAVRSGWRLGRSGAAEPLDAAALPRTIADPSVLKDPARARRFAGIAKVAFAHWTPDAVAERDGVPDPFPPSAAKIGVSDLDRDGRPELLAWRARAAAGFLLDPEQRVDPVDDAVAAFRGNARLAFVLRGGTAWCLYDRDRDGTFDLALASGDEDGGAVRQAFTLGGDAPVPAPDQVGRLLVRPGLLRVPGVAAKRVVGAFERLELETLLGRAEAGLASFPPVLGSGWRASPLPPPGATTAAMTLSRAGAEALVADLSGRVRKMTAAAAAKALAAGTLPVSFAWLSRGGFEWTYYDRNGDGRLDLVLVSPDPQTGRSVQAYALDAKGVVTPAANLAEGPLFRASVFARKDLAARARGLYEAIGVKPRAREP